MSFHDGIGIGDSLGEVSIQVYGLRNFLHSPRNRPFVLAVGATKRERPVVLDDKEGTSPQPVIARNSTQTFHLFRA